MKLLPNPCYSTQQRCIFGRCKGNTFPRVACGEGDLIVTSPPFALHARRHTATLKRQSMSLGFSTLPESFMRFERQRQPSHDIGGSWNRGEPTRSLYHYELLLELCAFPVIRSTLPEFFWYNPAKLPTPAEWVTVRRERVKDAVDCIWWLSKSPHPKASNRKVLQPYSESMEALLRNGYKAMRRPTGMIYQPSLVHAMRERYRPTFCKSPIPKATACILRLCRENGMKPTPARYPAGLPEFFIKMLTDEGDLVVDPFAGSNVTGEVCERLNRNWIAVDVGEDYLEGSRFRFNGKREAGSPTRKEKQ